MKVFTRNRFYAALLAAICVPSVAAARSKTPSTTTEAEYAYCNEAIYRLLPGDFNFCLARKLWAKRDYKAAEQMFLLAAGWGSKPAQQLLGLAYLNGAGLSQNRPLGLAWLALAAERKDRNFLAVQQSANSAASPQEREAALILQAQLWEKYWDNVTALRAKKKLDREISAIAGNPAYNTRTCIAGITHSTLENDGTDDGSTVDAVTNCSSTTLVVNFIRKTVEPYFEGWKGKVDVGPLEQAREP